MTPTFLTRAATDALAASTRMSLVMPKCWKRPRGFPRGELLCVNAEGERVYSFDPVRILAWLTAHGLVHIKVATGESDASK